MTPLEGLEVSPDGRILKANTRHPIYCPNRENPEN